MPGHLALRQGAGRPLHPRFRREWESPANVLALVAISRAERGDMGGYNVGSWTWIEPDTFKARASCSFHRKWYQTLFYNDL